MRAPNQSVGFGSILWVSIGFGPKLFKIKTEPNKMKKLKKRKRILTVVKTDRTRSVWSVLLIRSAKITPLPPNCAICNIHVVPKNIQICHKREKRKE